MINKLFRGKNNKVINVLKENQVNSDVAFIDQVNLIKSLKKQEETITIFDIGAFEGNICLKYKDYFQKIMVHAFEPFPESFKKLKEKADGLNFIRPVNFAISNISGKQAFYCNKNNETNSLFLSRELNTEIDYLTKTINSIEISTITIDEYVINKNIKKIDILKMDIQGGELLALEGAVRAIEQNKISLIYTEVEFISIYDKQPLFLDIANFLNRHNYTIYGFYNFNYIKNQLAWGDVIFINKNIFNNEIL